MQNAKIFSGFDSCTRKTNKMSTDMQVTNLSEFEVFELHYSSSWHQ